MANALAKNTKRAKLMPVISATRSRKARVYPWNPEAFAQTTLNIIVLTSLANLREIFSNSPCSLCPA
jgi:hypothetical protein